MIIYLSNKYCSLNLFVIVSVQPTVFVPELSVKSYGILLLQNLIAMRYLLPLLYLLLPVALIGQNLDHPSIIKKSKRKSLTAYITVETPAATEKYKHAYWEFNENGHIINEVHFAKSGKVTRKFNATYQEGRLLETLTHKEKIKEKEKITYEYNDAGNLKKKAEYRNGKLVIYFEYFYTNHQLDSVIWFDKKGKAQLYEYYQYEADQLIKITEKTAYGRLDGKTDIYYYPNGKLKEEKLFDGFGEMYEHINYNDKGLATERKIVQDTKVTTLNYTYAGNGLLKKIVSDHNQVITYKYKWSKKTQLNQ